MRQNCLEEIIGKNERKFKKKTKSVYLGIEIMKSIEELDLSDNFITIIPEQIRNMMMIKRV
jgi:aspartate ammonia-lyase